VVKTVSVTEVLGRFIKGNSYLIIFVAVLLLLVAIVSAQTVHMETGIETNVFTYTQLYKDIDYYNHHYNATSALNTFLILVTTDDVYDPQVLDTMSQLGQVIGSVKKVTSVTGIYTYLDAAHNGTLSNEANIEQQVAKLPASIVQSYVIDRYHSLMYVTMQGNLPETEKPPVLDAVKKALQYLPMPPGMTTFITGTTARKLEIQNAMISNMSTMLATAVVLMLFALWFTFRVRWRLLPLPIVLIGVIYTGGIMGAIGIPLTMVSMAVFPILIGMGVEYAIQFQNRMMEELNSGKDASDAVVATVKGIGPPVLYSVTCTGLGFAAILISPVPMVFDFGLMCLIGIIVCFLTALFLLLTVLFQLARRTHFTVKKGQQKSSFLETAIERVAETTTRHPEVIIIATLLMLAGYMLDPSVGVEVDVSNFVPQDLPSIVQYRSLSYAYGVKPGDMMVMVKAPDATSADVIRWEQDFSNLELRDNPDVLSVDSLATVLAANNNGTLPSTDASIQQAIAALPPDELNKYVDDTGSSGVIIMNINTGDTPHLMSMLDRVQTDLNFLWPPAGVSASLTGEQMVSKVTLSSLAGDRLKMTMEAGLMVFIALLIIYKGDWVRAFVPTFCVIIVTGLSCIVMVLLGMKYTPLSTTLGSLTIGIGVDFSILHMSRYYEEKAKGYSPREAMRIATGKIGAAIFCSASTVIAGFGALVMSNFPILSNFGIVTIIDFVMALCSAFMIMPPLLVTLDTWWMKRTRSREAVPSSV